MALTVFAALFVNLNRKNQFEKREKLPEKGLEAAIG